MKRITIHEEDIALKEEFTLADNQTIVRIEPNIIVGPESQYRAGWRVTYITESKE